MVANVLQGVLDAGPEDKDTARVSGPRTATMRCAGGSGARLPTGPTLAVNVLDTATPKNVTARLRT